MSVSEGEAVTAADRVAHAKRKASAQAGDRWRPKAVPRLDDRQATGRSAGRLTWHSRYLMRLIPCDVGTGFGAGLVGLALKSDSDAVLRYVVNVPVTVIAWVVALMLADAYGRRRLTIGSYQMRAVGRAAVGLLAAVAVAAYLTGIAPSRTYLFVVLALMVLGSLAARLVLRQWLRRNRAAGRLMQRTVVIGRLDSATSLVTSLTSDRSQGLLPVAVCGSGIDGRTLPTTTVGDVPILGPPDDAIGAVDLVDAEVVAVASHPDLNGPALRRLSWALEDRGVELIVAPGLLDVAGPRLSIRPSQHLSLLHVERPSAVRIHILSKSVMDRCLSAALLIVLAPLLLAIAIAVKLGDRGPMVFRQERVGVRGERFTMYKFRTMRPDAEDRLAGLLEATNGNGMLFKMEKDPRVTRVGAFLRRYSLDELPQLINVLFGDMSLVGPRPPLPREVDAYEPDALRRLRVRPGMTGLWQVSGRSDLTWEESLRLDLHYVDNWSPMGDLHIMLRTIDAVFRASGAY